MGAFPGTLSTGTSLAGFSTYCDRGCVFQYRMLHLPNLVVFKLSLLLVHSHAHFMPFPCIVTHITKQTIRLEILVCFVCNLINICYLNLNSIFSKKKHRNQMVLAASVNTSAVKYHGKEMKIEGREVGEWHCREGK